MIGVLKQIIPTQLSWRPFTVHKSSGKRVSRSMFKGCFWLPDGLIDIDIMFMFMNLLGMGGYPRGQCYSRLSKPREKNSPKVLSGFVSVIRNHDPNIPIINMISDNSDTPKYSVRYCIYIYNHYPLGAPDPPGGGKKCNMHYYIFLPP